MPSSDGSLTAVFVSGGKQYRGAPGDRILVDRLAGEPGSELTLDRVLLVAEGDQVQVGAPVIEGLTVVARVIAHRRGPKIDVLRYKSKKRVRVHRGARADLTAIEIIQVGDVKASKPPPAAPPSERAKRPKAARADEAPRDEETVEDGS